MANSKQSLLDNGHERFKERKTPTQRAVTVLKYVIFLAVLAYLFVRPTRSLHSGIESNNKKNVIFMVTDGMGPTSLSLARSYRQFKDNLPINDVLTLDKHLIGSSRTRSSSSLVTDSAAGATAFSCGLKSYNGAIGVGPDKEPCGTILEAMKLQGYLTGLVVTTRITDATPAAFSSHVDYRFQEDLIAEQQLGASPIGRVVDLILGGGRCHFYGCRNDDRNLLQEAQDNGTWNYVGDREQFDQLQNGDNVTLPLLGLLADTDIPYEIDRNPEKYPSLAEEVKVALNSLSKATEDSDQGFFLLIEGSRIDHAGHHNDPAAQVREVLAYDQAFEEVLSFVDSTDTDTVVLSTSDHETGGLAASRQVSPSYPDYLWYPEVLLNSSHSGEYLAHKVMASKPKDVTLVDDFISNEIFVKDMGINNASPEELETVKQALGSESQLLYTFNNMISVRSQTGWTTHGHSAVDVNIYAYTNSDAIRTTLYSPIENEGLLGSHENIELGRFMETFTGVDLDKISEMVREIEHHPGRRMMEEGNVMVQQEGDKPDHNIYQHDESFSYFHEGVFNSFK